VSDRCHDAAKSSTDRAAPPRDGFGIAYTSFVIRMLRGRDVLRGGTAAGLPAQTFVDLVHAFGGSGCQMDLAQFAAAEPSAIRSVRDALESRGLFVELSVPARSLEDPDAFAQTAAVARELGATRLRVALLYGRRYEDFQRIDDWRAFVERWRRALPRAALWLERARLHAGIENHKDFLGPELAELLRSVGSAHMGACLDFGNNLALLEQPLETVEALAPYAVTTHLKDMAVRACDGGFELSEVPLGRGILPLTEMVETIRQARPDARFCLEMITRDPLRVPFRQNGYWATYDRRERTREQLFETSVLAGASEAPLPRITGLTFDEMIAAEDDNVRACVAYARGPLGL
jgi:sugar phosphate isomerase/epimerase